MYRVSQLIIVLTSIGLHEALSRRVYSTMIVHKEETATHFREIFHSRYYDAYKCMLYIL